jgi:quercetin dioxygenase-like cupin family protein
MKHWHLPSIEADGRREPRVLFSTPEARAVLLDLATGDVLRDHRVRERAVLQVVAGRVRLSADGSSMECDAGTIVAFEPGETHAVEALDHARVLLFLAPWPGEGHYDVREGVEVDPHRLPANASAPARG